MKTFVVNIHSFIDVITNSSTELFVVNKAKVKEEMQELFEFIVSGIELDYETSIDSFKDSSYSDDIILPEDCSPDDCYMIHVSHSNVLLEKLMTLIYFLHLCYMI